MDRRGGDNGNTFPCKQHTHASQRAITNLLKAQRGVVLDSSKNGGDDASLTELLSLPRPHHAAVSAENNRYAANTSRSVARAIGGSQSSNGSPAVTMTTTTTARLRRSPSPGRVHFNLQPQLTVEDNTALEPSVMSLCFSFLDRKVSSIAVTADGSYCIAAFSSGSIRLFDMTVSGNADPEDRYGYLLGKIDSASQQGSLVLHLELGGSEAGVDGISRQGRGVDSVCHLFAGSRQGSNRMIVVDLRSLRELKRRRGFLTRAAFGVQCFSHENSRLRGFTSLTTVSSVSGNRSKASAEDGWDADGATTGVEYKVTYRLLCGRSYGQYNIWEVTLQCIRSSAVANSSSETVNSRSSPGSGLKYSETWTHIASGGVGGPTLVFGCLANIFAAHVRGLGCGSWEEPFAAAHKQAISSSSSEPFSYSPSYPVAAAVKSRRLSTPSNQIAGDGSSSSSHLRSHFQIVLRATEGETKLIPFAKDSGIPVGKINANPSTHPGSSIFTAGKGDVLRGQAGTLAASDDGRVLFGGLDQLIVTRFATISENGSFSSSSRTTFTPDFSTETFSLYPRVTGGGSRRSRHLRQIENIWCTCDGKYALVLCSDNAVLLYSTCNVFGVGDSADTVTPCSSIPARSQSYDAFQSPSSKVELSAAASSHASPVGVTCPSYASAVGFLTLLFQGIENVRMELKIAYAEDQAIPMSSVNPHVCPCCSGNDAPALTRSTESHLSPCAVLIAASWWGHSQSQLVQAPEISSAGISVHGLEGVLRVTRLASLVTVTPASSAGRSLPVFSCCEIVSRDVSVKGVGAGARLDHESGADGHRAACGLCGDSSVCHWGRGSVSSDSDAKTDDAEGRNSSEDGKKKNRDMSKRDPNLISRSSSSSSSSFSVAFSDIESRQDKYEEQGSDGPESCDEQSTESKGHKRKRTKGGAPSISHKETKAVRKVRRSEAVEVSKRLLQSQKSYLYFTDTDLLASDEENFFPTEISATRVAELEEAVALAKAETELIMRKADRRFEQELALRRSFNADRRGWERERESFLTQIDVLNIELRAALRRGDSHQQRLTEMREPMTKLAQLLYTESMGSADSAVITTSSITRDDLSRAHTLLESGANPCLSSGPTVPSAVSTESGERLLRAPFCVVCQAHTADVVLIPCGHVCFCMAHMRNLQQHRQQQESEYVRGTSRGGGHIHGSSIAGSGGSLVMNPSISFPLHSSMPSGGGHSASGGKVGACPVCKVQSTGYCRLSGLDVVQ